MRKNAQTLQVLFKYCLAYISTLLSCHPSTQPLFYHLVPNKRDPLRGVGRPPAGEGPLLVEHLAVLKQCLPAIYWLVFGGCIKPANNLYHSFLIFP